ncbi:hypothetical protein [Algicola sagamiensis]|uniref:hypothetical protein n=1 Tax=Algicola sagamiensis TaxID=163869 RepID=UPI00037EC34C|nr:hypothetical protein [Algicola sagamiensis]
MGNVVTLFSETKAGYQPAIERLPEHLRNIENHKMTSRHYRITMLQLEFNQSWAELSPRNKKVLFRLASTKPTDELLVADFHTFSPDLKLRLREAIIEVIELGLVYVNSATVATEEQFRYVWGIE